jgi:hypothetical protein
VRTSAQQLEPGYLDGPTKMAVVGVPLIARVLLKLTATAVI